MPPSDTYFTAPPEWHWLVILYFFFGGIAGGSYFIAALIDLVGAPSERPLARLGYLVAFPAVALCGPLLILDLNRPERFWHMLIQSENGLPMFKSWSPMSLGSWIMLIFALFAFLSFLAALADAGTLRLPLVSAVAKGTFGRIFVAVGAVLGLLFAGYTGVLLTVTNRPIWGDNNLLGLLFLVSGISTAAALLILLGRRRGAASAESVHSLTRLDTWFMLAELLVLILVVVSLGAVAQAWLNAWGLLLLIGVVLLGILVPLVLHWGHLLGRMSIPAASALVLVGGFILRAVVVLSSEAVHTIQ